MKVQDVFGVSKELVKSYYERPHIDALFKKHLNTDKHIVIYGGTKQGKTSLVERHLPFKENIVIMVNTRQALHEIYSSVLRKVGMKIESESHNITESTTDSRSSAKVKVAVPILGSEISSDSSSQISESKSVKYRNIDLNLDDPDAVGDELAQCLAGRRIIIENFHYLNTDVQKYFAYDLRIFQQKGIKFVILGIWRQKNKLMQYNGELQDRVEEVEADQWTSSDFDHVINIGCNLLNVSFSDGVKAYAYAKCYQNIGLLQEFLKELCLKSTIEETSSSLIKIEDVKRLEGVIQEKSDGFRTRFFNSLESLSRGRRTNKASGDKRPLFLPYYLIQTILTEDVQKLDEGLTRDHLENEIKGIHHRKNDVRPSDMTHLLHNLTELQEYHQVNPLIFDYDQTTRVLKVIDSTFLLFKEYSYKDSFKTEIPNPLDEYDEQST
jgi:hypothetical protein